MNDKTLSFTRRSLAEALDNVRCLSDFGPEVIAAQVFAASAQQPAQAVPDGWKLVPFHATREQVNAVFMHPDLARTLYRNMVEAAPAAPVAQEPVAWSDGQCREFVSVALRHVEVKGALHAQDIRDGLEYMACRGAGIPMVLGMPPAAEQPAGTTSDRYRAELYDEVWEEARALGFGNVTEALTELARQQLNEQPDTVAVPREVLRELTDTAITEWHDPSVNEAAHDRNECLCCGVEDGHNADCAVAIALRLLAGGEA